jgi:hypothetical protein
MASMTDAVGVRLGEFCHLPTLSLSGCEQQTELTFSVLGD